MSDRTGKSENLNTACQYEHSSGCTHEATHTWESITGLCIPCCKSCYDKREARQDEINNRYLHVKPFSGQNEDGEYYDENSY